MANQIPVGRSSGILARPVRNRLTITPRVVPQTRPVVRSSGSLSGLPTVAPDPPSLVRARQAALTQSAKKEESRPWYLRPFENLLNVVRLPVSVAAASPTIAGKTVQTVVGAGQTLLGRPEAIVDGKPVTKFEFDLAEGRKKGLSGVDLAVYSTRRAMPIVSEATQSMRTTPPFLAETLTGGLVDTGAPGFDIYQAYNRGQLPGLLFEHGGNIILAGRLAGLGNVGVRLGSRIAADAATGTPRARFGQAVSTVGRFTEEPIGTTVRGAAGGAAQAGRAYAARTGAASPRMLRLLDTLEMMSTSKSPLMTGATRAAETFRLNVDTQLSNLDARIADLSEQRGQADLANDLELRNKIDEELVKLQKKRKTREKMGETSYQANRLREESTRKEEARQGTMRTVALRFDDLGAAPEPVETLRKKAVELRQLADQREQLAATVSGDEAARLRDTAESARRTADFNDRMADVKEANPEKLQDKENRAVNFEAAMIVNSKLIDQIIADLDAGLTFDEVMARIQPKELVERTIEAGYVYTPEGVQRAIDFVRGAVDEVDRLEMDVASQIVNMFAEEMRRQTAQQGTLVGGVLSPTQFGDIPMPEILIKELDKYPFANRVYRLLDNELAAVIREGFDDLVEQLGDKLDSPQGLFKKFASARPDSREYTASYFAVARILDNVTDPATSVFRNDSRLALQVAQFFSNEAIYPARMRPMMAYRQSAMQEARASDVVNILDGLNRAADEFPDMLTVARKTKLTNLMDTLIRSETAVFDRKTYFAVQDLLNGIIRDITKRRQKTEAGLGEAGSRFAEIQARLAEVEAQARAAAGMVEQALLRPEELVPGTSAESQGLRSQAESLRAEAARLSSQPAPEVAATRYVGADTAVRDNLQKTQVEQQQTLRDTETKLAQEERVLSSAVRDAQEPDVLLAEVVAAEELARQGVGAEPLPAEQKAWKAEQIRARQDAVDTARTSVDSMFAQGEPVTMAREDFWVEDIWVALKRAIPNTRHFREFFQRLTETKYADVPGRIPTRAELAPPDPNVGKLVRRDAIFIDEVVAQNPRGPIPVEEWTLQLGEAWTAYMKAVDDLNEMKRKPLKSDKSETVKDMMMRERSADVQQQQWENPRTGETMYGVRPLAELRRIEQMISDTEALARQVEEVQRLRTERDRAARSLDDTTSRIREIDARIQQATEKATAARLEGPQAQARRLTEEANRLTKEADRLDAEAVRLRPSVASERITLTTESGKRLRVATPRRGEGGEVTGYEFTKGVARKLDQAETAQLAEQQATHEQIKNLQDQLNAEDQQLVATRKVSAGAQEYPSQLGMPSGPALLQGVQRPRLLGETDQPAWMPVGEASGVFASVRAPKTITTEGMAAEQRASIENQRQSTFMPLTAGQFAQRMTEIMNQTGRNRVVNSILSNEQFVTDVQTLLTPEEFERMRVEAERKVRQTGISRNTGEMEQAVRLQLGNDIIIALDRRGFEPVSSVKMPDPTDPYAGREAVGDLLGKVDPTDIEPTTLVMKKGLRENIAAQYQLASTETLPPLAASTIKFVQENTAAWKSVVLPFSLRWQVGDFSGNIINAAVRAGLSPADTMRLMLDIYNRVNPDKPMTLRQLSEPLFNNAITDPVISVIVGAGLQTSNIKLSELNQMHPRGGLKPSVGAGRFSRRFFPRLRERSFNFNETQNALARSAVASRKLTNELDARGRSINEIDPLTLHNDPVLYEAVVESVKSANEALGNFSKMSFGEKQYIRSIYPFWSWIKFINTAAGQLLLSQPDRVLFYTHLGSMVMGDDADEFYGWLKAQVPVPTPWGTFMMDLSFLNPYADAVLLQTDPFASSAETLTGISPVISFPLSAAGELAYARTGNRPQFLPVVSRPGYLEGRPGETTRTTGDVLGGIGYQAVRAFGGPFRLVPEMLPNWRVPGTDVLLGPGPRYPQGSPRTTGLYARPRLTPTQQRISAALRTFGIPAPTVDYDQARLQAAEQRRAGARSLRRREQERRLSRIGR